MFKSISTIACYPISPSRYEYIFFLQDTCFQRELMLQSHVSTGVGKPMATALKALTIVRDYTDIKQAVVTNLVRFYFFQLFTCGVSLSPSWLDRDATIIDDHAMLNFNYSQRYLPCLKREVSNIFLRSKYSKIFEKKI